MAKRKPEGLQEMGKYEGELDRREIEQGYEEILEEVKDSSLERRTLLKAFAGGGGLATLNALFAQKKFLGDDLESGLKAIASASDNPFGVREVDEPPYDVNEDYTRFDGRKKVFRMDDVWGEPSGNLGPPNTENSGAITQIENGEVGHGSESIGSMGPVEASSSAESRALFALAESDVDPGKVCEEPIKTGTFHEYHGLTPEKNELVARKPDMTDPKLLKQRLYKVGRMYGMSDMGVADRDDRWWYSHSDAGVPIKFTDDVERLTVEGEGDDAVYKIPDRLDTVVGTCVEMPIHWGRSGHSLGSGISSNFGYEGQSYILTAMAKWIEMMGYHAVPAANHGMSGPSVPVAIDAGLGEQGRHGRVIHPQLGSHIRVQKILTDMPLEKDSWIEFGAQEFCKACKVCAEMCPANAIPTATEPSREWSDFWPGTGEFKNEGLKYWPNNGARCMKFWGENGTNDSQCIASCPFSLGRSWLHDVTRSLAGSSKTMDQFQASMARTFGYENHYHPEEAWDKDYLMWGRKLDPQLGGF